MWYRNQMIYSIPIEQKGYLRMSGEKHDNSDYFKDK